LENFIVSVTIKEVSVKGGVAEDIDGGLPSWAQGSWSDWWTESLTDDQQSAFNAWAYFDKWYYEGGRNTVWHKNWSYSKTKYTVIEANNIGNDVYDVIFSYPVYTATDAQKKAALAQFFIDNNHEATLWHMNFDPWNEDVWNDALKDNGINAKYGDDNLVIWFVCKNPNHFHYNEALIISPHWEDVFLKKYPLSELQNTGWWDNTLTPQTKKANLEKYFSSKGVKQLYYDGWWEKNGYTCWEPNCEVDGAGGWWKKTHYYVKWGVNGTGIQGDWEKHDSLFNKWSDDDYLVKYLINQNVQPVTWYTRVRIRKEGGDLLFQYYDGADEALKQDSHSAPPCDTKSLSAIRSLTFDSNYWGWSYYWHSSERTSPRN
jgi:hypothetical protein